MTDKVHPSFAREAARSRETSVAIAYAGASGDGWVWPATSRLVEDSEGDLATGALGAFDETSSGASLNVDIASGEAARRGAYLARDVTTTITLPASATTTLSLGWRDGQADTILIGEEGTAVGDSFATNDPRKDIWTFTTDGSGVTAVTDHRQMADDYRIPNSALEDVGLEVQDGGVTAVSDAAILDFDGSTFSVSEPTTDEANVELGAGGVVTAHLADDAVTAPKVATDAVGSDALEVTPFSYEPGMTEFEAGLTDEVINRWTLAAGEQFYIARVELLQKAGGTSQNANITVVDAGTGTVYGSAVTIGSRLRDVGATTAGQTVAVWLTNDTGGTIEVAPRVQGWFTEAL